MESDEIIRRLSEASLERLEQETLGELDKMSYGELMGTLIQTRFLEREILTKSAEIEKQIKELENNLGYCEEMEEYLRITFIKNFEIDPTDLNIEFVEGEDVDGNA